MHIFARTPGEMAGSSRPLRTIRFPCLLTREDIKGTFHCHSTYSDGVNTIEQMAEAARTKGWSYLGIADHSKAAAYAGGLSIDRVKEQIKEIDALNARAKNFRIFKGTECDILPDGTLDYPDKVLALFDYVVISIHSSFSMSEEDMTRRIVKGLKNKFTTMLGHPTGRLLLSREPYPVNMTKVIDAAAEYGKFVEINAHPMRLDLDWRLCKYARDKGVCVSRLILTRIPLRDSTMLRTGWGSPERVAPQTGCGQCGVCQRRARIIRINKEMNRPMKETARLWWG